MYFKIYLASPGFTRNLPKKLHFARAFSFNMPQFKPQNVQKPTLILSDPFIVIKGLLGVPFATFFWD